MTSRILLSVAFGFGLLLASVGCNSTEPGTPATAPTPSPAEHASLDDSIHDHSGHDHADHDHGAANSSDKTDMEKMDEALADFSDEDRQSALNQHFCPVTGEMLGAMGAPEKVDVNGQNVWICCDGCKDKLLAAPDKYLSKLNK